MAEQTESSGVYDFLAWLEMNWKRLLAALAVIAVAVLAILLVGWKKKESEKAANQALFALPAGLTGSRNAAPPSPDAFLNVSKEYSNTDAAERAELIAAGTYFTQGKFAEARALFQKFASDHPDSDLKSQAVFGIAACLEAEGKTEEAMAKYKEIAAQYRGKNVAPQASLALGRMYEAQGKPEEALKIYSEVESTSQFDPWRGDAAQRREQVLAQHPDLAKPTPQPGEQILEVTTPPEGSTNAPEVKVITPDGKK